MRAFDQGAVAGSTRTQFLRKDRDDQRAKHEATEAAEVLKEFVAAFEEPVNKNTKTFVKGGVFNPGSHEETPTDRGKTYRASGSSTKKEEPPSSKDTLQQQIAKSTAAAQAAAAALSATTENKPVRSIE